MTISKKLSNYPPTKRGTLNSNELILAGRLAEALASLNQAVKHNPGDYGLRTQLFEVLCVLGEWPRAARTLEVLAEQSVEVAEGVQIFRKLLIAEEKRRQFLAGGAPPRLPVQGTALAPYLASVKALADGKVAEAASVLNQAEGRRQRPRGQRSGIAFDDLRDADDRFATVLEVFQGEDYLWLPLAELRSLRVYPPRHLRDIVFAPAMVDWGQGQQPVFMPVRYPGSERDARPEVQLARRTTTRADIEDPVLALGHRALLLNETPVPLLQLGLLERKGGVDDAVCA